LEAIRSQVEQTVVSAIKVGRSAPEPTVADLLTDVYA